MLKQGCLAITGIDNRAKLAAEPPDDPALSSGARLLAAGRAGLLALRQPVVVRRILIAGGALVALGTLALVAAGILLVTRDFSQVASHIATMASRKTGASITIGKAELRYWPLPRIVLQQIDISAPHANLSLSAPRGILRLGLVDLLDGTVNSPDLELNSPEIRVAVGGLGRFYASPRGITEFLDAATDSFSGLEQLSGARLTLRDGRILVSGTGETEQVILDPVEARFRYRAQAGRLDITARRSSALRPLEFSASLPTMRALGERENQPAAIHLSGIGSRARFDGRISRRPDLALSGQFEASFREDFERLIGISISRGQKSGADDETRVSGAITLDPRGGGLQGLTITRGSGALTGIAAIRENAGRWSVSATLAGDLVDGTATHQTLQKLRMADGTWSRQSLDINPTPGIDLDIRLSTKQFRLGKVALEDAALSIFTRRGRAEYAIAESRYAGGTLKARVSLTQSERGQDVRLQLAGDKIESETLFEQAFGFSRLRGPAHFVFQAETSGTSIAEFASNLNGTGSADIKAGQISGLDANRLMTRLGEIRPEAALLASLGGRTSFETLASHLVIRQGRIEPGGSNLVAPRMVGLLEGWIDLVQQRHDLAIILRRREELPSVPSDFFAFRIEGPLFSPSLRPDPSLLSRRS